jgi:hypothetical protein
MVGRATTTQTKLYLREQHQNKINSKELSNQYKAAKLHIYLVQKRN